MLLNFLNICDLPISSEMSTSCMWQLISQWGWGHLWLFIFCGEAVTEEVIRTHHMDTSSTPVNPKLFHRFTDWVPCMAIWDGTQSLSPLYLFSLSLRCCQVNDRCYAASRKLPECRPIIDVPYIKVYDFTCSTQQVSCSGEGFKQDKPVTPSEPATIVCLHLRQLISMASQVIINRLSVACPVNVTLSWP